MNEKLILKALKEIMEQTGGGNTETYLEIQEALSPKENNLAEQRDIDLEEKF